CPQKRDEDSGMLGRIAVIVGLLLALWMQPVAVAADKPNAERGRQALLNRTFIPATIPPAVYADLWRTWGNGVKKAPADYHAAVRDRYGLHPTPYPNDDYPMGLRQGNWLFTKGLGFDCLICHGGSVAGQNYIGLGNASLDFQALVEDLASAAGRNVKTP